MQSEGRDGSIYRPPEILLVFMTKRRVPERWLTIRTVVDVACVSRPEIRGVPTETRTEIPGESMLIYKRTNADVPFTLARVIKPGGCVRTEVRRKGESMPGLVVVIVLWAFGPSTSSDN